ncbi:MAG: hypothetical protein M1455_05245 [Actinobacteria bacterium]|nr:hypothetical protein [Actinomycetota bacterium]
MPDDTNVHDTKLLAPTLAATVIKRLGHRKVIPHQCMDKGYDNPTGREACEAEGYIAHIHRRGVKKLDSIGEKTHPARRLTIWSTSH